MAKGKKMQLIERLSCCLPIVSNAKQFLKMLRNIFGRRDSVVLFMQESFISKT